MKKFIILLTLAIAIISAQEAFADIVIQSYHYDKAFTIGETVTCTVVVKNTGPDPESPYLLFAVTRSGTTTENYGGGVNVPAGETRPLTATWNTSGLSAGSYSVSMIVYEDSLSPSRQDTEYGAWGIQIGSTTETLSVFPTIIDMGVLPAGRYMHPVPIEITWDYFIYNRLRHQRPWYMRIYTNNASRYKGIPGAILQGSPAGLVSSDGKYTTPLKIWCLNYGPDEQETGWSSTLSGPPPVEEDTYWKAPLLDEGKRFEDKLSWERIPDYSEMTAAKSTWRNLIGQTMYDGQYVTDLNMPGDFTLSSPFSAYLAMETGSTTPRGNYSCELIVEIYSP